MKTKPGLKLRRLGNRFMIVDTARPGSNTTAVHSLNATAADIWAYASSLPDFSVADIARFLTETYTVDTDTATADAGRILRQWAGQNLIIP